jgi:hypothetical protein
MATLKGAFARLWPLVLGIAAVALMYMDWREDPFDPALEGTRRYGHNHDGALTQMAVWVLVELVVLYVVLGPGSASARIWRASLALMMHAGGIVAVHGLWLLVACVGLVAVLVARIVTRPR